MSEYPKELICLEYPAQVATDNPSHAQIVGLKIIQCDHFTGFDIEQAKEIVRRWNSQPDLYKICDKLFRSDYTNGLPSYLLEELESAITKAQSRQSVTPCK